ncbi:hypothetical protein TGAMA5MH_06613 [Trichoderma gamsii]|uniref:Uncharacterized protein n=1 Tax=Trichoderma gamsii TaxID=398673 RepID=A0A2K0T7K7_9HYPO|nr:hypothetical protein TGAMA5MH_06613 [Trichoderma gamsii]
MASTNLFPRFSEVDSKPEAPAGLTLESWSQGFMVGALLIMTAITLVNMRRGVLLHKLILLELLLAVPNGFFTFWNPPAWGWYLSSTAVPLIASWTLHNVIAWMKSRGFLNKKARLLYIGSVILVQPYWILEIYANFAFFNGINTTLFPYTRPFEGPCRDPWWIFTTANLFWNIRRRYEFGFLELIKASPRFGILLGSMCLSVVFIILDLLAVTPAIALGVINPYWKLALVFKCLTDTIILDDFKSSLDKLSRHRFAQVLPQDNWKNDMMLMDMVRGKGDAIAHVEDILDLESIQPAKQIIREPPRVFSK